MLIRYIQDLFILSRLNDLTNCYRCFNVDITMLCISGRDHARKLKIQQLYSSAIYKQNASISSGLIDSGKLRRGYYF